MKNIFDYYPHGDPSYGKDIPDKISDEPYLIDHSLKEQEVIRADCGCSVEYQVYRYQCLDERYNAPVFDPNYYPPKENPLTAILGPGENLETCPLFYRETTIRKFCINCEKLSEEIT